MALRVSRLLAALVLALPSSADVLVGDAAGSGDFNYIQRAIAAASEGDTISCFGRVRGLRRRREERPRRRRRAGGRRFSHRGTFLRDLAPGQRATLSRDRRSRGTIRLTGSHTVVVTAPGLLP